MVTIHLIGPCATSGPYANSAEETPGFGVLLRSLAHPPRSVRAMPADPSRNQ
jgi:hypothetical protein